MNDNARKTGRIEYGAIGGGALVSAEGMEALSTFSLATFEPHDDGVRFDARMTFGADTREATDALHASLMDTFLGWARTGATRLIELDITREFVEELVDDAPGILTMAQLTSIRTNLVGWHRGIERQSKRGTNGIFTTPLHLCHEVVFEDPNILKALLADPLGRVRCISPAELATTNGGRQEGQTHDGHVLFSSVFDPMVIQAL